LIDAADPRSALDTLVRRLSELGVETYGLDLTRQNLAVPVARIMAPALQLEPSTFATARLAHMIATTGGGATETGSIPLI